MATVLAFALIVGVDGVLSLLTDRDVIVEPDAGPLVPVAMTGMCCALVFALAYRRRPRPPAGRALAAALGSLVLAPLAGGLAFALARGELASALVFFAGHVLDRFVIAAAVIAGVVVLAHAFVPVAER